MIYTSFEYPSKSTADRLADFCLQPVHYLFNGKTVTTCSLPAREVTFEERSTFSEKTWLKTAAAVLALIPGVLLGIIFKRIAWSSLKPVFELYQVHQKNHTVKQVEKAAQPILILHLLGNAPEVLTYAYEARLTQAGKIQIQNGVKDYVSHLSGKYDVHLLVVPQNIGNIFKSYSPMSKSAEEALQSPQVQNRRCIIFGGPLSTSLKEINPELAALPNLILEERENYKYLIQ